MSKFILKSAFFLGSFFTSLTYCFSQENSRSVYFRLPSGRMDTAIIIGEEPTDIRNLNYGVDIGGHLSNLFYAPLTFYAQYFYKTKLQLRFDHMLIPIMDATYIDLKESTSADIKHSQYTHAGLTIFLFQKKKPMRIESHMSSDYSERNTRERYMLRTTVNKTMLYGLRMDYQHLYAVAGDFPSPPEKEDTLTKPGIINNNSLSLGIGLTKITYIRYKTRKGEKERKNFSAGREVITNTYFDLLYAPSTDVTYFKWEKVNKYVQVTPDESEKVTPSNLGWRLGIETSIRSTQAALFGKLGTEIGVKPGANNVGGGFYFQFKVGFGISHNLK